jgi:hypothetical protein
VYGTLWATITNGMMSQNTESVLSALSESLKVVYNPEKYTDPVVDDGVRQSENQFETPLVSDISKKAATSVNDDILDDDEDIPDRVLKEIETIQTKSAEKADQVQKREDKVVPKREEEVGEVSKGNSLGVRSDGKMNVLFLVADDLRSQAAIYGKPTFTPNLARLAARGVVFDRAYSQVIPGRVLTRGAGPFTFFRFCLHTSR